MHTRNSFGAFTAGVRWSLSSEFIYFKVSNKEDLAPTSNRPSLATQLVYRQLARCGREIGLK